MSKDIVLSETNNKDDIIQDILKNFKEEECFEQSNNNGSLETIENSGYGLNNEQVFSQKEERIIKGIQEFIDINNSEYVKNFGSEFQSDMVKYANNIIDGIVEKEMDETDAYIKEVLVEIESYNKYNPKKRIFSFLQPKNVEDKKNKKRYMKTQDVIKSKENELKKKGESLKILFEDFSKMGEENKKKCYYLKLLILAGENVYNKECELLEDRKNGIIDMGNPTMDTIIQEENLKRWKRKLDEIKIVQFIGKTAIIQINNIKDCIEKLTEKIETICTNFIPLWRISAANMIGMEAIMDCADLIKDFENATNSLLISSSEMNKEMVKQITEIASSDVIKADTINKLNDILILGLSEAEKTIQDIVKEERKGSEELKTLTETLIQQKNNL